MNILIILNFLENYWTMVIFCLRKLHIAANPSGNTTQGATGTVDPIVAITATWAGVENGTIQLGHLSANNIPVILSGGAFGEQVFDYSNVAIDVTTNKMLV